MDLESSCSIQEAAEMIEKESGGTLDALVNNAGSGVFSPVASIPLEQFDQQWQVLVRGPYLLTRELLPLLKKSKGAKVIQVTSLAARFPIPMMGVYSAGKAALSALTQSFQIENESEVEWIDLQPGDISTAFNQAMPAVENLSPRAQKIRHQIDLDLAKAPPAELVAQKVYEILQKSSSAPRVAVGDLFQSKIAPFLQRIVPRSWINWGIRKYYGME